MNTYTDAVTGAGGFTGRAIAERLANLGRRIINLSNHPEKAANLNGIARSVPLEFGAPERLASSLEGVSTLYNTYWIRFEYAEMTFEKAVQNSKALIEAARLAGVKRIIHISALNPSLDSPVPYYRCKAQVEELITNSGLSYAILRPAMIFGENGVLINNLAWFIRRLPVFALPGSGEYRMQPVYVGDIAELAVNLAKSDENIAVDAVGPEVFTFSELAHSIKSAIGSKAIIARAPASLALLATSLIGIMLGDIILTRDELRALTSNMLVSSHAPTCPTHLSQWLRENADLLGRRYIRDLRKR
ncbi:MAG: SDR family oxidoreductase [Armatimonadota bacterium]